MSRHRSPARSPRPHHKQRAKSPHATRAHIPRRHGNPRPATPRDRRPYFGAPRGAPHHPPPPPNARSNFFGPPPPPQMTAGQSVFPGRSAQFDVSYIMLQATFPRQSLLNQFLTQARADQAANRPLPQDVGICRALEVQLSQEQVIQHCFQAAVDQLQWGPRFPALSSILADPLDTTRFVNVLICRSMSGFNPALHAQQLPHPVGPDGPAVQQNTDHWRAYSLPDDDAQFVRDFVALIRDNCLPALISILGQAVPLPAVVDQPALSTKMMVEASLMAKSQTKDRTQEKLEGEGAVTTLEDVSALANQPGMGAQLEQSGMSMMGDNAVVTPLTSQILAVLLSDPTHHLAQKYMLVGIRQGGNSRESRYLRAGAEFLIQHLASVLENKYVQEGCPFVDFEKIARKVCHFDAAVISGSTAKQLSSLAICNGVSVSRGLHDEDNIDSFKNLIREVIKVLSIPFRDAMVGAEAMITNWVDTQADNGLTLLHIKKKWHKSIAFVCALSSRWLKDKMGQYPRPLFAMAFAPSVLELEGMNNGSEVAAAVRQKFRNHIHSLGGQASSHHAERLAVLERTLGALAKKKAQSEGERPDWPCVPFDENIRQADGGGRPHRPDSTRTFKGRPRQRSTSRGRDSRSRSRGKSSERGHLRSRSSSPGRVGNQENRGARAKSPHVTFRGEGHRDKGERKVYQYDLPGQFVQSCFALADELGVGKYICLFCAASQVREFEKYAQVCPNKVTKSRLFEHKGVEYSRTCNKAKVTSGELPKVCEGLPTARVAEIILSLGSALPKDPERLFK